MKVSPYVEQHIFFAIFYSSVCIFEDGGLDWWISEHKMTYFSSTIVFLLNAKSATILFLSNAKVVLKKLCAKFEPYE